ncbi:MAG: hypothetical protein HYS25_14840 [Ignavibacteriales bacterium]|nr:hypothetical protein [Ignavibacteriales bacterium]
MKKVREINYEVRGSNDELKNRKTIREHEARRTNSKTEKLFEGTRFEGRIKKQKNYSKARGSKDELKNRKTIRGHEGRIQNKKF